MGNPRTPKAPAGNSPARKKLALKKDTIKDLAGPRTGAVRGGLSAQNCSKQVLTYTCVGNYTCNPIIGT